MKHLATVFADMYRKRNWLSADTIDCMEYTLKLFVNECSKFLLYGMIFFPCHLLLSYVISYLVFVTLRLFAGGVHCKTYWGCLLLSFIMIAPCVITPHILTVNVWILMSIALISILFPIFYAPVTPSFRIIKTAKNRNKLRIIAAVITLFWILIATVIVKYNVALSEVILYSIIIVNCQLVFPKKEKQID